MKTRPLWNIIVTVVIIVQGNQIRYGCCNDIFWTVVQVYSWPICEHKKDEKWSEIISPYYLCTLLNFSIIKAIFAQDFWAWIWWKSMLYIISSFSQWMFRRYVKSQAPMQCNHNTLRIKCCILHYPCLHSVRSTVEKSGYFQGSSSHKFRRSISLMNSGYSFYEQLISWILDLEISSVFNY